MSNYVSENNDKILYRINFQQSFNEQTGFGQYTDRVSSQKIKMAQTMEILEER